MLRNARHQPRLLASGCGGGGGATRDGSGDLSNALPCSTELGAAFEPGLAYTPRHPDGCWALTGEALLRPRGGALPGLHPDGRPPGAHEVGQAATSVRAAEPEPGERHIAHASVDHLLQVRLRLIVASVVRSVGKPW